MERARHPLYSEHPLDETINVTIGWESFGTVGRYKNAKTWFAASPKTWDGAVHYCWSDRRFDSRQQAECYLTNQWHQRLKDQAIAEAKKDFARQFEALRLARSDVRLKQTELEKGFSDLSKSELIEKCDAAELAEALKEKLGNGWRNSERDEVVETLRDHLADAYVGEAEDEIRSKGYDEGHEAGIDAGKELAYAENEPMLRAVGAAAYDALTDHDRSILRDYLAREHNAYNKGCALLL